MLHATLIVTLEFAKLLASSAFAPYVPYSRALNTLFVRLKIFSRWICSPTENFHFPRLLKALQTVLFDVGQKTAVKLIKRGKFLNKFKTWNQFNFFVFFFSSLQHEVINFLEFLKNFVFNLWYHHNALQIRYLSYYSNC